MVDSAFLHLKLLQTGEKCMMQIADKTSNSTANIYSNSHVKSNFKRFVVAFNKCLCQQIQQEAQPFNRNRATQPCHIYA